MPSVRVVADEERAVDGGAAERGLALGVREVDAEVLGVPRRAEIGSAVLDPEMVLHRGLIVCAHTIVRVSSAVCSRAKTEGSDAQMRSTMQAEGLPQKASCAAASATPPAAFGWMSFVVLSGFISE